MPSQSLEPLRGLQGEQKVKYTFIKSKRVEALDAIKACLMGIQQTAWGFRKDCRIKRSQKIRLKV